MAFEDKLQANFAIFDYKIVDKSVFTKFAEICKIFEVDEDGIVENWVEFVDDDENKSSSTDITAEKVEAFEKWCAANIDQRCDDKDRELPYEDEDDDESQERKESKNETKIDSEILEQSILNVSTHKIENDEDILEMYGLKKDPIKNIQQETSFADSEETQENKENEDEDLNASTIQNNSGEIVLKFGFEVSDWKNASPRKIQVKKTDNCHVKPNDLAFHNKMSDYNLLNTLCRDMAMIFIEIWLKDKNQLVTTSNVREKIFNEFRTWGRIISDSDGKLTTSTILLMGDPEHWYHSLGEHETEDLMDNEDDFMNEEDGNNDVNEEPLGDPQAIEIRNKKECILLDVSRLKRYSFFPGQIIGVEGKNPTRDTLYAYKVIPGYSCGPLPPKLNEPLNIMVAAGPFATKSHNYQQLYNLMDHVAETEPHLLILIGPFNIDANESECDRTYKDIFEDLITKIMSYVDGKSTQVVIVSSYEEIHHDFYYPTPEYQIRTSLKKPNLHLMPDPCTLDVDGLIIGVTSVDIIRHLSSEEISYNMPRLDRLGRIAEHLLLQSSYYPLFPPAPDVPLDILLWSKCCMMNTDPHILLVPSAMQYFYKYSNGTHIINPSKVSKGLYSQFNVRVNDQWSENSIGGEIIRI